ncbi:MAG TPA: MoxR family ATPase [Mycobacteriales bacterium]|nr:MoxR family ATPase [Mycobacteriales bacterium]
MPPRRSTPSTPNPKSRRALSRTAVQQRFEEIVANIGKVIKGKDQMIRLALTALTADGHIVFEDMPGTGKTMLARAIAQSIDATASRIQCTPDLLPTDVTGSSVLDRQTGDFVFREGPVFANVFLVDEVNRATPKTQSALLEAMAERRVSFDGVTRPLPRPFFVLATMNPIELAGTFALPEAQLDRFLFRLTMGYPDAAAEREVLDTSGRREAIADLGAVTTTEELLAMIEWANDVTVEDSVKDYIVNIVGATRNDPALAMGASTRASLALLRASRAAAASQGRDDVLPDDVRSLAPYVLGHRLVLTPDAILRDETIDAVIERLLSRVKAPVGAARSTTSARAATAAFPVDDGTVHATATASRVPVSTGSR